MRNRFVVRSVVFLILYLILLVFSLPHDVSAQSIISSSDYYWVSIEACQDYFYLNPKQVSGIEASMYQTVLNGFIPASVNELQLSDESIRHYLHDNFFLQFNSPRLCHMSPFIEPSEEG